MAFVDKRTQLATNQALGGPAVTSDSIDLGAEPSLRGMAVSGCYLVICITQNVSTASGPTGRVAIELTSSTTPAGGTQIVHWSAGSLDITHTFGGTPGLFSSCPVAGSLVAGWTYVIPLSHKATYLRYLQVTFAVDGLALDAFESGAYNAYITTVPPYSSADLMPDRIDAVV